VAFTQVKAFTPEVCKTVGLAYPGSNPGPATSKNQPLTCANGQGLISSRPVVSGQIRPFAAVRG